MPEIRPILQRWRTTPWVAATPVDARTVGRVLDEEVQIAFRGDGPLAERELVPLTRAARELLFGTDRAGANRVLRGALGALDGWRGAADLRGVSLASDPASFATHMLLSNVEAGFLDDSVARGDRAAFEGSLERIAGAANAARAQNSGWLDLGPRVSGKLLDVVRHGDRAGSDAATEVAQVLLHEAEHTRTPNDASRVTDREVAFEEGVAEALAWWPGRVEAMRARLGAPTRPGEVLDPFTVAPDLLADGTYRERHRSISSFLALAGIEPLRADGSPDPTAYDRAVRALQSSPVNDGAAARDLARAIARHRGLGPDDAAALPELLLDAVGDRDATDALVATLGR